MQIVVKKFPNFPNSALFDVSPFLVQKDFRDQDCPLPRLLGGCPRPSVGLDSSSSTSPVEVAPAGLCRVASVFSALGSDFLSSLLPCPPGKLPTPALWSWFLIFGLSLVVYQKIRLIFKSLRRSWLYRISRPALYQPAQLCCYLRLALPSATSAITEFRVAQRSPFLRNPLETNVELLSTRKFPHIFSNLLNTLWRSYF